MAALETRLLVLEERKASSRVISGLSHFYGLIAVTDKVGGSRALLGRLDAGQGTDADRAAVAAVPGGAPAIRAQVTGLAWFYGGQP